MPNVDRSLFARACGPLAAGSLRGCVVSLVFSALGAGMLTLPWAVARLGIFTGIGVLFASAVFSYATMEMLITSGLERDKFDYADTMKDILGLPGAALVNIIVAVDSAGAICVFYKYMADSLLLLATSLGYQTSTAVLIFGLSFFVVFPLSVPRRITAMQKAAMASILPLTVVIGLIVLRSPFLTSRAKVMPILVRTDLFSIEAAQACSAIFFSFMCHMNVWAVRNELYNPEPRRTSKVFGRAVAILFAVYASVAVAGTISFGEATPANILEAYPASDLANRIAHVLMAMMLVVCSVLCVHPVRSALAGLLGYDVVMVSGPLAPSPHAYLGSNSSLDLLNKADGDLGDPLFRKASKEEVATKPLSFFGSTMLTLCVIAGTCTVAIAVPSIVDLLGVLGGFCGVILMFVLPTFIYAKTKPGVRATAAVICTIGFAIIGLFASVGSLMPHKHTE